MHHDKNVGQILALLDTLGIANDTLFFYSTDNGPHENSWPDADFLPQREELQLGRRLPRSRHGALAGVTSVIHATGAAQFVSPGEILSERISHGFKARAHMPLNPDLLGCFHGRRSLTTDVSDTISR